MNFLIDGKDVTWGWNGVCRVVFQDFVRHFCHRAGRERVFV
jgi:hypothetical protein